MARRGYRFIAPLCGGNDSVAAAPPQAATDSKRKFLLSGAILLAGVVVGFVIAHWPQSNTTKSGEIKLRRLTANPEDNPVAGGVISPDGKYLAFADNTGFYLREVDSGETHALKLPPGFAAVPAAWYPDGTHLIATWVEGPKVPASLWQISIMGGTPRKLIDDARRPAVSRQGSQIAIVRGANLSELWVMQSDGENPRRLVVGQKSMFGTPAWSPDGRRIAFVAGIYAPDIFEVRTSIEMYDLDSGRQETLLSAGAPQSPEALTLERSHPLSPERGVQHFGSVGRGWVLDSSAHFGASLVWTADNQLLYSLSEPRPNQGDSNVWSVPLDSQGHVAGSASRLTATQDDVATLNATADGKRIAVTKYSLNPDVYVAEVKATGTRLGTPQRLTLDERRDLPFS